MSFACADSNAGTPAATLDAQFGAWWHDGKAELSGYSLSVDRYGHRVTGNAVLIYVTEPFSRSKHVKMNAPSAHPADAADVLKLNLVRHFQTGIYDYSTQGSTFAELPSLNLLKSAFSSTEWCGQVYEQLDLSGGTLSHHYASYFEGESATGKSKIPAGGMIEDELFVWLRGFGGAYLQPGETQTVPFLASAFYRRLAHRGLEWGDAKITRGADVPVPTGTTSMLALRYQVHTSDGRDGSFLIEADWPHRVVSWEWTANVASAAGGTDSGVLLATARLPYWELHNPGDESMLAKLGLPVPTQAAAPTAATPE